MAQQIHDIIKDFSLMTGEEQVNKILELRRNRTIVAVVSNKPKDRPAKKTKKNDKVIELLAGMSEEAREKFLKKLLEVK